MDTKKIYNGERVALAELPHIEYNLFCDGIVSLLADSSKHCVNYFARRYGDGLQLFCCIADDSDGTIHVTTSILEKLDGVRSIAAQVLAMERYEREIAENYGVIYEGHPWMKPVRYSHDRADGSQVMDNYPFYKMNSEELHEVGVGPVHAGVIEPGHFRFICDGEKILHLEIQLGYQHRGVERLMVEKKRLIERCMLAESVAGDTAVGHSIAFASVYESLAGFKASHRLNIERMIALEMERAAIHTGDLSAICGDVAYQLGNAVFGRLRTPLINFMQQWCGNRLGKGCIRPSFSPFAFTEKHEEILREILEKYEHDFKLMWHKISRMPSTLARLERTGIVTTEQVKQIGAVGMAARASGLERDIRMSHPSMEYALLEHKPIVKHHGDVYSRTQIRREEILQSFGHIRTLMDMLHEAGEVACVGSVDDLSLNTAPDSFAVSLVEGWRGEICHCAITGGDGRIVHYKIKDPSFHNWMALALAVRGNEISDFPICNKSFNLSYCGHDL